MVRNRSIVNPRPGILLQPFVVSQLVGAVIEQVVEGSAVSPYEYAVHSWIVVKGGATPTELARELGVAPTTLSATLARLVEKGQLRRVRHPRDGRSYVLQPTAAGRRSHARNGERLMAWIRRIDAELGGSSEETLEALRRLEAALRSVLAAP
jgi:DNA-binding MarR family transcriptional regulator